MNVIDGREPNPERECLEPKMPEPVGDGEMPEARDPVERDSRDIVQAGLELEIARKHELELAGEEASIDAELALLQRRKQDLLQEKLRTQEVEIMEERRIADDLRDIQQAGGHAGHGGDPKPPPCDVTIIINTADFVEPKGTISYMRVVELAYPDFAAFPQATYSIMFERGFRAAPQGVLSKGGSVEIADGMRFRVKRTGES